jgi:3-methyl-2-oxobutanoate hydroxymethyltransferase
MSVTTTSLLSNRRITTREIRRRKAEGGRISMLTAYDSTMAALVERGGIDMILVGDSVGNTMLGYTSTVPVTMDAMVHHTQAVVRATSRGMVIFDLPFGTCTDPETALRHSIRALQEAGAQAVKLEGDESAAPIVRRLTSQGIPVVAHIGLQPQQVHQLGGYPRFGKSPEQADSLLRSALALQEAGAFAIVLECVEESLAGRISQELAIPTIGIGSGRSCDGQVLVIHDLIGLSLSPAPSFARPRAQVASIIEQCVREFVEDTARPDVARETLGHA